MPRKCEPPALAQFVTPPSFTVAIATALMTAKSASAAASASRHEGVHGRSGSDNRMMLVCSVWLAIRSASYPDFNNPEISRNSAT